MLWLAIAFSSANSEISCSVIAPPSCSASTMVTALAVIARDVVADADGGEFDVGFVLDLVDHMAQMAFEIIAGVHRQR